jgi:hypothetical protein
MELENLNLVELNIEETQEIAGGDWPSIGWWMDIAFGYGGGGGGGFRQQLMADKAI